MATIKIEAMGGMRPQVDQRMLPDQFASYCANVHVRSGALRPLSLPSDIYRWEGELHPTARRLRFNDGTFAWYPLSDADSAIIKAPLVNDLYERFYILDPPGTPLRYNTRERILAEDPPYLLGLPVPAGTPTVTATGGTGTLQETRAYVVTYVDEYGQEGPPSGAGLGTGLLDASWSLAALPTTIPNAGERPAVTKRIYRTAVTDNGAVSYRRVASISLAQATYNDAVSATSLSLAPALETLDGLPPLPDLDGIALMPGGFLVAWQGRTLHMSETYRPWAWPPAYDLSLEHQVVAAGVIDQTLIVATTGAPYAITGNSPAAMTPSKHDRFEPCIARSSLVSGLDAVYYASANGLIAVNANGARDLTEKIIGRDVWLRDYASALYGAARVGSYYMALNDQIAGEGFLFASDDPRESVVRLQDFTAVRSVWSDSISDDVMAMQHRAGDSVVVRVTPRDGSLLGRPAVFSWRSKEFFLATPSNFSVLLVNGDEAPLSRSANDVVTGLDIGRFAEIPPLVAPPVDPESVHARLTRTSLVGFTGIGLYGAPVAASPDVGTLPPGVTGPGWNGWPYWPGVGGSEGRDPATDLTLPEDALGIVRVFANRMPVYKEWLQPNRQVRLPSGFKASTWQILIVSRIPIYSVHMATTGKELANV